MAELWALLSAFFKLVFDDPVHLVIAVVSISIFLYAFFTNKSLRNRMNQIADLGPKLDALNTTTNQIAAAPPLVSADFGNAVGSQIASFLEPLLAFSRTTVDDLRAEKLQLQSDKDNLKDRLVALETTTNLQAKQIAGMTTDIHDLQFAAQDKETRLNAANQTITDLRAELHSAQSTIEEQTLILKELTPLREQVKSLQADVEKLRSDVEAAVRRKDELEKLLADTQTELAQVKAERDAFKVQRDSLAADLQVAQDRLKQAQDSLNTETALHALHENAPAAPTDKAVTA
jgi:DNA repair exonuclease SbcCD ATPase subunit